MTRISEISSQSVREISKNEYIRKFAKQMLKNTLFIGTFKEKRFVESLNSYRNVISIAREEEDFIKNLMAVKKRMNDAFSKQPWIGITEPNSIGTPVGYNLWVELSEEVFGKYWYKVKTVEFLHKEIRLKLEIIRPVRREHTPVRNNCDETDEKQTIDNFAFRDFFKNIPPQVKQNLAYFLVNILTFENTKKSVIFITLLIGTIVTGGAHIIQYLMEYVLLLIRELSGLIKSLTPVIIMCLNLLGKTIFGFYYTVVALFRDKSKVQPVYNAYYTLDPNVIFHGTNQQYNRHFNKRLPYYSTGRPGVTITDLED